MFSCLPILYAEDKSELLPLRTPENVFDLWLVKEQCTLQGHHLIFQPLNFYYRRIVRNRKLVLRRNFVNTLPQDGVVLCGAWRHCCEIRGCEKPADILARHSQCVAVAVSVQLSGGASRMYRLLLRCCVHVIPSAILTLRFLSRGEWTAGALLDGSSTVLPTTSR
jgi:hypothetical protein